MTPFCDYLGVSFPLLAWDTLRADLDADVFAHLGLALAGDTLRLGETGLVLFGKRGGVAFVSFSGNALATLRDAKLYSNLLAVLMAHPHRVTRLHATLDLAIHPEPFLRDLYARARSGALQVTRKAIAPSACTWFESTCPDGSLACSFMGGHRRSTRALVYDKARESWVKRGVVPSGPILRVEMQVRRELGPTLHDAYDCESLFWHLASPGILPRPDGVPLWRSHAQGFVLDRAPSPLPAARARRVIDRSDDLALLGRIAADMGSADGLALVQRWACRRIESAYDSEVASRLSRAS